MVREGYKETEIGEIPVEWVVESFSEACDLLINGGTPNTQVPKYWDGSIPWITGADVVNQKIENIRRYITEQAVEDSSTSVIPKECLLVVTRTGVGKLAITPFDVAISQDITGVIPKKDYDIEYLFWVLNASRYYFQNLTQGTSINGITRNDLIQFKFAVPPLPEQHRIAAVLSTIDEAIEKTEALIDKLRQVKAGLMQDLLTKGIDEEGRVRSEETHAFKDSELGRVPVEWEVTQLKDVISEKLQNGYSGPETDGDNGLRALTLTAVTENKIDISNTKYIEADYKRVKDLFINKNDIFVERSNTLEFVGLAALYEGDIPFAIYPDLLIRIRASSELILPKILLYILLHPKSRAYFQRFAKGTSGSMKKIDQKIIGNLPLPLSPLPEQHRLAAVLTTADDQIAREEAYRDKLLAMKKGLMADLLTGKVRVPKGKSFNL
ncbi:Type I restriction enzyme EcoKI specificity protein [Methanoculleus chikugoensis]|uniref:Type I restriction enzyme EcoKI specificity protein n=1 Tax=Methanoculleus chikugoensis TaxID=118126 RepID=A0A1M4MH17_9EURY|nr:restriction endonuclease subunit S [Methanoculleus chikugoensis]SCL74142.1 Type I restriction enzyme EcoKI specificity protein [Methanoculleus chikugoensis]